MTVNEIAARLQHAPMRATVKGIDIFFRGKWRDAAVFRRIAKAGGSV